MDNPDVRVVIENGLLAINGGESEFGLDSDMSKTAPDSDNLELYRLITGIGYNYP